MPGGVEAAGAELLEAAPAPEPDTEALDMILDGWLVDVDVDEGGLESVAEAAAACA